MLKAGPKSIITLLTVITLCTCIDPYSPKLTGYNSLLVVDGLITDENSSYTIKLSRTIKDQNTRPEMVTDATVYITENDENTYYLLNIGGGIYKTDSTEFTGESGKSYRLHIISKEGNEYESEPCLMKSSPEIDSVYYIKEQNLIDNGTVIQDGLAIYLDSRQGDNNDYYRWAYEETWKFRIPTPKKYIYIDSSRIVPVSKIKEFCWKNRKSDEVLIHAIYQGESSQIEKEPILFIAPDKSDRLLIQYSILVKQYSVSKSEYDFWDKLKQINETGGDIFGTQPFPVSSNIHNINIAEDRVLGYFQVAAVKQKRITITFNDITELNLPVYQYPCERIEMSREDYPRFPYEKPMTWQDLYAIYCLNSDYDFIEPVFKPGTTELEKMVFAKPECADCELTGTLTKPDFWIDLD